jgi:DNA helicase-2/ATP-dependent DNA helicase PcrA
MAFTPNQQDAIDHDGHLLIVAGPGSGKTTTSVAKARRILKDPQRNLIMVTFTKDGAEEMRKRLDKAQEAAGEPPISKHRLRIGTFHSIALQHLFDHRPHEKVLGPAQQGILLNEAISPYAGDMDAVKAIRTEFESFMYAIDRDAVEISGATRIVVNRYMERLRASRATDLYTVMRDCAIFSDNGTIPTMRFTDMLVDEGQDTDELQKVWIFAHARSGVNVTIVGDDDQSIYEWRQALGYSGMKSFMDTFGAKRIELGDNFRCKEEILTHAVILVQHNKNRLNKHLVAQRGTGGKIACYHTPSAETQCDELAELISETPKHHQNVAILARKNRSLNDLEMSLTERQISYIRQGKSIWDDMWVSTYLSLLQSLLDASPVGVFGCLSTLGLDDGVKTELLQAMHGSADDFLEARVPDLNSATPTDAGLIKEFAKACKYWRDQLRSSAGGSVDEVVLDAGEWMASKQKSRRTKELLQRAASILGKLKGTLSSRLNFIARNKKNKDTAPVTLMTMHASKGMEFETVHVIDAGKPEDGSDLVNTEAERRLMYVALTRAKNRCFVWYSGEPHPTLREAQLEVLHQFTKLVEKVNS